MRRDTFQSRKKEAVRQNSELIGALWPDFVQAYPTVEDCKRELFRRNAKVIYKCRECGAPLKRIYPATRIKCESCGEISKITEGTFLDHMKKPRAWLAALWLREHGVVLSSPVLAKLARVATSTALNILKTTAYVLVQVLDGDAPMVSSGELSELYCKRSRDTPRRNHPVAEVQEIEKDRSADTSAAFVDRAGLADFDEAEHREYDVSLPDISILQPEHNTSSAHWPPEEADGCKRPVHTFPEEAVILAELSSTPITPDQLIAKLRMDVGIMAASLTMLEVSGLAQRVPGDRYVRTSELTKNVACTGESQQKFIGTADEPKDLSPSAPPSHSLTMRRIMAEFVEYIKFFLHGISRKTVQLYFATFWYHKFRKKLPAGWLIDTCLQFGHVKDSAILNYVSPSRIKLFSFGSLSPNSVAAHSC